MVNILQGIAGKMILQDKVEKRERNVMVERNLDSVMAAEV